MTLSEKISKLSTQVEQDSYTAQCDMRKRAAELAGTHTAVLEQLLHAACAMIWLQIPGPKTGLSQFIQQAIPTAFDSCMMSGAFEDISDDVLRDIFEGLTHQNWDEFFENMTASMIQPH